MTPPAATAAARAADPRIRRAAPSGPRRVSGPARGRTTTPARRQAAARTRINASRGMTRPTHARTHGGGAGALSLGTAVGAGVLALPGRGIRSAVRSIPAGGSLTDRILRSRAIIGVVAGLLIGLVFLQVTLLKMNTAIGQSVQQASTLESQNAVLRGEIAQLSEDGRITEGAGKLGMVMPAADAVRFLNPKGGVGGAGGAAVADGDASSVDDGSGDASSSDGTYADDGSGDTTAADDGSGDTSDDTTASADDGSGDSTSYDDTSTDDTASADSGTAGDAASADVGSTDSGGAVAPG